MTKCKYCGVGLLNAFEGELCMCSSCIKKTMEAESKVSNLLKAEQDGKDSSDLGKDEDANPYPSGTTECVMWLHGWNVSETMKRTSQAIAVIRWATASMRHIHEISAGYGYDEIAKKTSLVIDKMQQFVKESE